MFASLSYTSLSYNCGAMLQSEQYLQSGWLLLHVQICVFFIINLHEEALKLFAVVCRCRMVQRMCHNGYIKCARIIKVY